MFSIGLAAGKHAHECQLVSHMYVDVHIDYPTWIRFKNSDYARNHLTPADTC